MSLSERTPIPKVEESGNVRIITFTGEMVDEVKNMVARELKDNLQGLSECHLLLDFTNVETLNSSELETLIKLHKTMQTAGGRLTLFNLRVQVFEVFWDSQLQQRLNICRE